MYTCTQLLTCTHGSINTATSIHTKNCAQMPYIQTFNWANPLYIYIYIYVISTFIGIWSSSFIVLYDPVLRWYDKWKLSLKSWIDWTSLSYSGRLIICEILYRRSLIVCFEKPAAGRWHLNSLTKSRHIPVILFNN